MADAHHQPSKREQFIRASGQVPNKELWGPAKWVVQLIQYMIAIMIITIGEGIKSIVTGEGPSARRRREREGSAAAGGSGKAD
jgi:hypothetical protein